jgi:hypothetical protein
MDSKLILIKCITLLYCESIVPNRSFRSTVLVLNIVEQLKIPVQVGEVDNSRNTIIGLRESLEWMCNEPENERYDLISLLQRVRLSVGDDVHVFESFSMISEYDKLEDDALISAIKKLNYELKEFVERSTVKEIIHKAHREVFYNKKGMDWGNFTNNLVSDLELHSGAMSREEKGFMLNVMNMSDIASLKTVLEKAKDDTEGKGGFRTGWQAVNRMLGEGQQFRRGMFVLVGALTHMYKSGFVHDLFRHFCIYNEPELEDPSKKPAIVYYSAENRAEEDLIRMYVALRENETGEAVNTNTIDLDEASEYISVRLQERGFEVIMNRIDPGSFTAQDLMNEMLELEAQGFEVQACCFDYLNLISKKGITSSTMTGEDTRALMQKVRVFMSARNILFITPHQLSQQAMEKKREGTMNFLAEIAGKNYWDSSKRIANEADLEIFLDIVNRDNVSYLHVHRGKHRTVKATPAKLREFYLPFSDVGYVPEDIDGADRSLKTIVGVGVSTIDFN